MPPHSMSVYILASASRVLYTGVTGDLHRRVWEHKEKLIEGFTANYNVNRLVYFELFNSPHAAIEREKQIKRWTRAKRIHLIERNNRDWADLAESWYPKSKARSLGSPD